MRCSSGQVVDGIGPEEDFVFHRRHRGIRPHQTEVDVGGTSQQPSFGASASVCQDVLRPALCALGQHAALTHVDASLHEGEMLFAFLDDIHILCDPSHVGEIFLQVKQSLARFAGVQVNLGKALSGTVQPPDPRILTPIGAEAWRGEGPEEEQGLVVLGVPVGHSAFVQKWVGRKGGVSSAVSHPEYQRSRTHSVRGCSS